MPTKELTLDQHDSTISEGIVLIDFWAEWCGPCKRFAPVYEKVSESNPDVVFAKVDTEAEPELAAMYGVRSIPTLVAYRDGIPVHSQAGALPQPVLEDLIGQVRALDMEHVRAQYAEQVAARDKV
ncbi:thioredoxin [Kineosporia sp. A_224]|uniref:thioredoxin n=1 Tax=Kineosporia sp. A_224 TaxID=1962180 RepID=UPI000B4B1336|nr:thioredoxin [Kineosporia sp. A_224]